MPRLVYYSELYYFVMCCFSPEFSLFVGDVSEDLDDFSLFTIFSSKYLSCKSANSKYFY